jgi:AmmeMemoRadiSam system protein B
MKKIKIILLILLLQSSFILTMAQKIRNQKDTVGFASKAFQMDSVMDRLMKRYGKYYDSVYKKQGILKDDILRFAVCPHDDYLYAGYLYNEIYSHIKAKTVIILGVAHKAKQFKIERKLVFDTYDKWHAAYSNVKISPLREQIMKNLPQSDYIIHDSLQLEEHSVEAFVPFLQYYNKNVEIVSILIPHMPFSDMQKYSDDLAKALNKVMKDNKLQWGKDIALIVSTDAVHYGDEDWGGKNYAPYGCDTAGYKSAVDHEHEIMKNCLQNPDTTSARKFVEYTVKDNDWHEYKWTWCGRYSVPFGLLTASKLQKISGGAPLKLAITDYSTSIAHKPLKVEDLQMGATAPANLHHWVGYAVAGFK